MHEDCLRSSIPHLQKVGNIVKIVIFWVTCSNMQLLQFVIYITWSSNLWIGIVAERDLPLPLYLR